jgi:hypothetical protein
MKVVHCNLRALQNGDIPEGVWSWLSLSDPLSPAPVPHESTKIKEELHLKFNDVSEDMPGLPIVAPTPAHAKQIIEFTKGKPHLIVQCTQGIGRSTAVMMAFQEAAGGDSSEYREKGTYNRLLYKLLRAELGLPELSDPLVSMVVRVKYPADRLHAFILCMQRQRHTNWELICVTDGPRGDIMDLVLDVDDDRVFLINTPAPLGQWGHPYRQLGIAAARGEFLGLSNDDNYYVPGYLEQMLYAIQVNCADIALCNHVHSYFGWSHFLVDADRNTGDIGAWIAKKSLIDRHVWSGIAVDYETTYLKRLLSGAKVVCAKRPLFVHN